MALSLNAVQWKVYLETADKPNELVVDDDCGGDGGGRMKGNRGQKKRIAVGFCFSGIELSIPSGAGAYTVFLIWWSRTRGFQSERIKIGWSFTRWSRFA